MSIISVSNLTFAYEGSYDNIFTDVSFTLDTDWKLGFCGRNGRGKTTFLNLLMGKYKYIGNISASVNFEYFPFQNMNHLEAGASTLEILMQITPESQLWQLEKELSKMEVTLDILDRPFSTLSGGERTKAMLAALFLRENSFLLIDEPTNHLDMNGRQTIARYLRGKSGFILVSHDRDFLDDCVDHILSINKTNIEVVSGNFSSWYHNKQRQDDFERAENDKLKKDIKRLESAAKQSNAWADKVESTKMGKGANKQRKKGHYGMDAMAYNGEKSRRMQQRRKNLERRQDTAINEKSQLLKNIEYAGKLKIHPLEYHAARLLALDNIVIAYGEREICSEISFTLSKGDRLALQGRNGSGKSSIMKLIAELGGVINAYPSISSDTSNISANISPCASILANVNYSGLIHIGSRLVISYVPQDATFLLGNLSDFAQAQQIDESLFKAILRKLDFSRVQFEKNMQDYSSGQKKKVLIAASLCQKAHVYIWDEPLNYIDILSRIQIEELIAEYQPTMIFVEHDRAFCRNIATEILML